MDKLQEVRENEQLRTLLMTECDIYFYDNMNVSMENIYIN